MILASYKKDWLPFMLIVNFFLSYIEHCCRRVVEGAYIHKSSKDEDLQTEMC